LVDFGEISQTDLHFTVGVDFLSIFNLLHINGALLFQLEQLITPAISQPDQLALNFHFQNLLLDRHLKFLINL